ncbi:MAG: hypothetical protein OEZ59_04215 [Deltaproteobacteria bacterium]|nr:hypothetical protein [Deltaproteobacteria bacterium]
MFKYRIRLTFLIFIALLVWEFSGGVHLRRPFDPGDILGLIGGLLVVLGSLLRSWSAGVIHKNDILATTGPYAICRHPLYIGSLNMALGFLIIINEPVNFLVLALLIALVYVPKIRAEEEKLAGIYGESWNEFTRTTGIFFPKRFPPDVRMEWNAGQWLKNREHHGFILSMTILVILSWLARQG